MNKLNGREVKTARVQTLVYIPGVGQLGPALDANSLGKKGKGSLKLFKVEEGLHLVASNFEAFVPNGNISCLEFMPEK